jgi:Integral membrane protein EMC3/TMCO1-like
MSIIVNRAISSRGANVIANSDFIEKASYLQRKAIFIDQDKGLYSIYKPSLNMANMLNPTNMMDSMMQGMFSSVFFFAILGFGSLFSGFIIAKLPFVVTTNFKPMLQQNINNPILDTAYVSTSSLYIIDEIIASDV